MSFPKPFKWTREQEKLFQNNKDRVRKRNIATVPNPYYPFHTDVDSTSIGTRSILVQRFLSEKRKISFNSRVFTEDEDDVKFASWTLWNQVRPTNL